MRSKQGSTVVLDSGTRHRSVKCVTRSYDRDRSRINLSEMTLSDKYFATGTMVKDSGHFKPSHNALSIKKKFNSQARSGTHACTGRMTR
jgi:hypothetical protein